MNTDTRILLLFIQISTLADEKSPVPVTTPTLPVRASMYSGDDDTAVHASGGANTTLRRAEATADIAPFPDLDTSTAYDGYRVHSLNTDRYWWYISTLAFYTDGDCASNSKIDTTTRTIISSVYLNEPEITFQPKNAFEVPLPIGLEKKVTTPTGLDTNQGQVK